MPNHDLASDQDRKEDAARIAYLEAENDRLKTEVHEWEESDKAGRVFTDIIDELTAENDLQKRLFQESKCYLDDIATVVCRREGQDGWTYVPSTLASEVRRLRDGVDRLRTDAEIARLARELVAHLKSTDEWINDSSRGSEQDWPVLSAAEYEATKALVVAVSQEPK